MQTDFTKKVKTPVDSTEAAPSGKPTRKPRKMNRRRLLIGVILPLWVAAAFMIAQAVVIGLIFGLGALGVSFGELNEAVFSASVSMVMYTLALALAIGVPWILKRRTTRADLGLQRFLQWKDYGWLALGFPMYLVTTMVLSGLAMAFLTFVDFEQQQVTGFESITHTYEYILAFLGLVIIAPIAEEVLFRGYLFGKLDAAKVKRWVNVLIVSVLFAVLHFQGNVGFDTFALSVVLCLLRIFSGSIWPAILLHMLKNGIAFYFLFINPSFLSTLGG